MDSNSLYFNHFQISLIQCVSCYLPNFASSIAIFCDIYLWGYCQFVVIISVVLFHYDLLVCLVKFFSVLLCCLCKLVLTLCFCLFIFLQVLLFLSLTWFSFLLPTLEFPLIFDLLLAVTWIYFKVYHSSAFKFLISSVVDLVFFLQWLVSNMIASFVVWWLCWKVTVLTH